MYGNHSLYVGLDIYPTKKKRPEVPSPPTPPPSLTKIISPPTQNERPRIRPPSCLYVPVSLDPRILVSSRPTIGPPTPRTGDPPSRARDAARLTNETQENITWYFAR